MLFNNVTKVKSLQTVPLLTKIAYQNKTMKMKRWTRKKRFRTQPYNNICFMTHYLFYVWITLKIYTSVSSPKITCIWMNVYLFNIQHSKTQSKKKYFFVWNATLKPQPKSKYNIIIIAIVWMPSYIHLCHRKINLIFA